MRKKESFLGWPIKGYDKEKAILDWFYGWLRYWFHSFLLDILRNKMKEQHLHKHVFVFNPRDNGGESLCLVTDFVDNGDYKAGLGDTGIYTNQRLSLQSYCNSAEFHLMGAALTPENLRKLANELESAMIEAKAKAKALV